MQRTLYKLIKKGTLTEESLLDCLVGGIDLNQPDDEGRLPLTVACAEQNLLMVRLLLEFGAKTVCAVDASGQSPLMIAYESNNFELLGLLLWKLSRIAEREKKDRGIINSSQYLENADQLASFKEKLLSALQEDSLLKKYLELKDAAEKITYRTVGMEVGGGNADDKIECAAFSFETDAFYELEYMQVYNWSYDVSKVYLSLRQGDKQRQISFDESLFESKQYQPQMIAFVKALSDALGIESVPAGLLIRFLIVALSLKWYEGIFEQWSDHMLYSCLMPEDSPFSNADYHEVPFKESKLYTEL